MAIVERIANPGPPVPRRVWELLSECNGLGIVGIIEEKLAAVHGLNGRGIILSRAKEWSNSRDEKRREAPSRRSWWSWRPTHSPACILTFLDLPTPARCTCRARRVPHHLSLISTDDLKLRSPRFASRLRVSNGGWT